MSSNAKDVFILSHLIRGCGCEGGLHAIIALKDFKTKTYVLILQAKSMDKGAILKNGDE